MQQHLTKIVIPRSNKAVLLRVFLASILMLLSARSFTQILTSGTVDTTFNSSYSGIIEENSPNNNIVTSCVQADGKVIVGGLFTTIGSHYAGYIARLNLDGSFDNTYNVGGGFDNSVLTIKMQQDGKIIVGGAFTNFNGLPAYHIVRLNNDGSRDFTFNTNDTVNAKINNVFIEDNGSIVIGGLFNMVGPHSRNCVARLNMDGSVDTNFNVAIAYPIYEINCVHAEPNGKVIIGGSFDNFGSYQRKIMRLNDDGSFDSTFTIGSGSLSNYGFNFIQRQSDGKILIGGLFSYYNGTSHHSFVRLNNDGSVDSGFDLALATGESVVPYSMLIQPDGKYILGGSRTLNNYTSGNLFARFNQDGTRDLSFISDLTGTHIVLTLSLVLDSTIFVAGTFNSYNGAPRKGTALFDINGNLISSFNASKGANGPISSIAAQPDGKIMIGGEFTSYNGFLSYHLARLKADGSIDSLFTTGDLISGEAIKIIVQEDGKILVAQNPMPGNSYPVGKLVRLNIDGSLDSSFNTILNSTIDDFLLLNNEQIIVTGYFSHVNNIAMPRIALLNTDGTLDINFNPGTGPNNTVDHIVQQSDGKIILGGDFTSYNGTSCNFLVRINLDGSLDQYLNPGLNGSVEVFAMQNDGRLIIGGAFSYYNGLTVSNLIRILPNGQFDQTFQTPFGNADVKKMHVAEDGNVFLLCWNDPINNLNVNSFVRLHHDGSVDQTFVQGIVPNLSYSVIPLTTFDMLPNNEIVLGGDFVMYNDFISTRIVKIHNYLSDPTLTAFAVASSATECNGMVYLSISGQSSYTFDIGTDTTITSSGYAFFDSLCPGIYSAVVTDDSGNSLTSTFIISEDSSFIDINQFVETIPLTDTLVAIIENCQIDYSSIDSIYIDSYYFISEDSVLINWLVFDINGATLVPAIYVLPSPDGDYLLQLQLYCVNKSVGNYFIVNERIRRIGNNLFFSDLGISEFQNQKIQVYPNPSSEYITISMTEPEMYLIVSNLEGKEVYSGFVYDGQQIKVTNYNPGMYFMSFSNSSGNFILKHIIE